MKYCKKCKVAAKETDSVCPKCKGTLSTFGSATQTASGPKPTSAPAPPPRGPSQTPMSPSASPPAASRAMFTLTGRIAELEQIKQQNLKKGRSFGLLSLLAALSIFILLYTVYSRMVLAYAVLENIKFEQDPVSENRIIVAFDVRTPGKVAYDRRSGAGRTEKLDLIATAEHRRTDWSWPSDPGTGIDFRLVSRSGWFLTTTDRHFDVTRSNVGVEVVFLMDVTSSMQPYIEGLKEKCLAFSEQIRRDGIDCRLGLIGFGDVEINEPITVFEPSSKTADFQEAVSRLELANGGDPDESGVEAIERAMELKFRPHTRIVFIHITDAGCHHRERLRSLADSLKENQVITYVVSRRNLRPLYGPLCVNGGSFYGLNDAPFDSILQEVAKSITDTIKSD